MLVTFLYQKNKFSFDITSRSRTERCVPVPKEKNKEWNISNIPKSKSTSPHLQLTQVQSPSPGDVPKKKKKENVSNVSKSKKNTSPYL
jgi:hypothetical protein